MQRRTGKNVSFFLDLDDFHHAVGTPLTEFPEVASIPLDFYRLNSEMTNLGGFDQVESQELWLTIASSLRLFAPDDSPESQQQVVTQLRAHYLRYLHPFLEADCKIPEGLSKQPPRKRQKIEQEATSGIEPLWQQVKSRSFARDAKEEKEKDKTPSQRVTPSFVKVESNMADYKKHGGAMMGMGGAKCVSMDREDSLLRDFGYDVGCSYTLETFKKMADRFAHLWSHCSDNRTKAEENYWRIIESGLEWVQVQYGADLDVETHGSGFPLNPDSKVPNHKKRAKAFQKKCQKLKQTPNEYMTKSGWNPNNLSEATFLHHIHESVGGITRPMLYVGMLFSSFCWHCEDNYLYSINYNHLGAPKLWYGVPGGASAQFEEVMRTHLPELFTKTPNLLYLLITQFTPRILKENGVPVYTATQNPGQFVVTCPRAYHAGFNMGFNCAESVNFALEDWLPICRLAVDQYRFNRSAVFPYEEFVLRAACKPDGLRVSVLLYQELDLIIKNEQKQQSKIYSQGITQFISMTEHVYRSCSMCGYDCFVSGIICNTHPSAIGCLNHSLEFCNCDVQQKRLLVRVHLLKLKQILDGLRASILPYKPTQPSQLPRQLEAPTPLADFILHD